MDDIRRALAHAFRRLLVVKFLLALTVAVTSGLGAIILARLAERMFALSMDWTWWFAGVGSAALIGAIAWTLVTRPRTPRVARTLDERADLRESLSTALVVSDRSDAWSRLVVDSARERARGVKVSQAIPIEAPRFWPVPLCVGLALLIVWIAVPSMDLLGLLAERRAEADRQQEIIQAKADADEAQNRVREAMARAGANPLDERGQRDPQLPQAGERTPEDVRREAVRSLTNMAEQIRQMQTGERAQQLDNLQQQMRQLRQPGPGPLNEFTRELARGNFEAAQQQLEQLAQQMAQGEMTPQQRAQAQEQLRNLSQQLQQNAESRARTEQALRNAGLSPQQAQQLAQQMAQMSPQQVQQALEQASQQMQQQGGQPMSQQQMQQLAQMAQAMQQAAQQSQAMSQAMQQMAQSMQSQDGMSQESMDAMGQMMSQLGQMSQMASEMNAADAAMNEAMAQLAAMGGGSCSGGDSKDKDRLAQMSQEPGEWSAGETQGRTGGGRSGGPGQGNGGRGPDGGEDGQLEQQRSPTRNTGQGPVIASSMVEGIGIRGDSVAEFQAVVESASTAAAEALETRQVRREYHRAIQAYFGRWLPEAARTGAATPQAPAQDAPDAGAPPRTP